MKTPKLFLLQFGVLIAVALGSATASAAVFTVNTTGDSEADGCGLNLCTLREAIGDANALPGVDTINFDQAIFGNGATIRLETGEIGITGSVVIEQSASATAPVTLEGRGNPDGRRIFTIFSGVSATLTRLVLTNGYSVNNTPAGGGAVFNSGTLNVNFSHIKDSAAGSDNGGGIYNNGGTVNLNNSTVSGSSAANGGGIYNVDGNVNLTNSTISGNTATNIGGGYYGFNNLGTSNLAATHGTIAVNSALSGGGIAASSAVGVSIVTLDNTIVGDNTAPTGPDLFSSTTGGGVITSNGYNLIENTSSSTFTPASTDITGTDPRLMPLALNGGTTPTHALRNDGSGTSPAIDQGSSAVSGQTTDQRGQPQYDFATIPNADGFGNGKDIGAFELQAPVLAAFVTIGGRVVSSSGRGIARVRLTLIEANGASRTAFTNPLGYYRFAGIQAGQSIVIHASKKGGANQTRALTIDDFRDDLNFVFTSADIRKSR